MKLEDNIDKFKEQLNNVRIHWENGFVEPIIVAQMNRKSPYKNIINIFGINYPLEDCYVESIDELNCGIEKISQLIFQVMDEFTANEYEGEYEVHLKLIYKDNVETDVKCEINKYQVTGLSKFGIDIKSQISKEMLDEFLKHFIYENLKLKTK